MQHSFPRYRQIEDPLGVVWTSLTTPKLERSTSCLPSESAMTRLCGSTMQQRVTDFSIRPNGTPSSIASANVSNALPTLRQRVPGHCDRSNKLSRFCRQHAQALNHKSAIAYNPYEYSIEARAVRTLSAVCHVVASMVNGKSVSLNRESPRARCASEMIPFGCGCCLLVDWRKTRLRFSNNLLRSRDGRLLHIQKVIVQSERAVITSCSAQASLR
jgi:hypothetical protein